MAVSLVLVLVAVAAFPTAAQANSPWGILKSFDRFFDKVAQNIKNHQNLRFVDWDEAPWAMGCIAKMRGFGIINGYEENRFKPNQAVKQIEALAMIVRAFDQEDEASSLAKQYGSLYVGFEDGDNTPFYWGGKYLPKVPASANWGLGYVLIAIDRGWVRLAEINPQAAASREWVATVMVRALGHEAQALGKMKSKLSFTDAGAVSPDRVGYVFEAVQMGLFEGYDDGSFKPKRSVSRAEMAAILERFLEAEIPSNPFTVSGKVTDISSKRMKVTPPGKGPVALTFSGDVLVLFETKVASKDDIETDDQVEVLFNQDKVALLVVIRDSRTKPTPPPTLPEEMVGTITAISTSRVLTIDLEDRDAIVTISLEENCTIVQNAKAVAFSSLRVGDRVEVRMENGVAARVDLLPRQVTTATLSGTIVGISHTGAGTSLTVQKAGTSVLYQVMLKGDCAVVYGIRTLGMDDIRLGDSVTLSVQNAECFKVKITARVENWGDLGGKIVEIREDSAGMSLGLKDGATTVSVTLSGGVKITYGDTKLAPQDLKIGDQVRVSLQHQEAVEIRIMSREASS